MQGKICQWKDDKGFGFIQPNDGSEQLFFHISSVKNASQRPTVGEPVFYEASRDAQHRLRATNVIVGELQNAAVATTPGVIKTEPPQKSALDYLLILMTLVSLGVVGYQYYLTQDIVSIWYFGLPAVVAVLLLNRQKKPKERHFNCRGCRAVAEYDARTLAAWKSGFTQLYCKACHSQWLRNKPKSATQPESNSSISKTSNGSGCLGLLLVLVFMPIASSVGLYHWLT
ncbi:cold shock domain-containing protein [Oceanisphaera sp. W20_SRM_FM3]|uniref:cold shock domain-containing protein n=1 Tax=Oceanisphaera sp. W20_SRM_FM3 TaxID=3240267 RepID=UPI003F97977C